MSNTRVPAASLQLIRASEGLRLTAYRDSGGVLTIGYGHTGPDVYEGMTITNDRAEALLLADATEAMAAVLRAVKVSLTENQLAALIDFVFNLGAGQFLRSTLLAHINGGGADIPTQLKRWVYDNGKVLPGLVKRREAEADLWNTP